MRIADNTLRFTGLASGVDTDEMVRKLMSAENMKADKLRQAIQLLEWRRDNYRDMTNSIRGFKDEYFNVLKNSQNFRSATAFSIFQASSSDTNVLGVNVLGSATAGSYSIDIGAIAKTAEKASTATVSAGYAGLTGINAVDMSAMKQGKEFTITLDDVTKTITLDADYTGQSPSNFATSLQGLVDSAFGSGKIAVSENSGKLTFTPAVTSSTLSVGDSSNTYLSTLGFSNGQSNMITSSGDITDFSGGSFKISIDGADPIDINVAAGAGNRDDLVANINTALSAAGVDTTVKAIADPDNSEKIKFVTLDTTKAISFTGGDTDDMLSKVNISSGGVINAMSGTIDYDSSDIGKEFNIKIDGTSYKIDLTTDYAAGEDALLQAEIRNQLTAAGAPADVLVNVDGGKISFSSSNAYRIEIEKGDDGLRDELGFSSTVSSSRIKLHDTLENISQNLGTQFTFVGDKMTFEINGITFEADKTDTMNDVMNKINNSDAGVTLRYNSLTDTFAMETKDTGTVAVINNTDTTGNFFAALNIDTAAEERGTDASLTIDGVAVTRSSNQFEVDGIKYDLKTTGTATVTVSASADELVDKIKEFVDGYNELIATINGELSEKRHRDYPPLTDEQKKEMSEKEIELWEEKAKSGLLRNDPILERFCDSMRRALYDSVEGVDIGLYDIGITTSNNYKDRGKLVIDEEKLKKAIEENPNKITQLFTKDSSYDYTDSANRTARYSEQGLGQRLYDIIQDNIRITRDDQGRKGILLEKAGIVGDLTESKNILSEDINDQNERLDDLLDRLAARQTYYYNMFARMEAAIQSMNSQSSWLMSQLGMGG